MLGKWFRKDEPAAPSAPEVMGLRLGGAFELDSLRLRLIEPNLIVEGVAKTHIIQAVGQVKLDENSSLLRFYTDDDGFCQVTLDGGVSANHVADVKLWYFYETRSVGGEAAWNELLDHGISKPTFELEGHTFERIWQGVGDHSPPVAMTERTFSDADGSESTETDQFAMLYEREAGDDLAEYLAIVGEEKIIDNRADRCLVISTGFDLRQPDIEIIG
ncbi:MAG: YjfK family protein [Pseudomonadota bacterium]